MMVQSVQRAFALLELLDAAGKDGCGLAELSRRAGLKPPTARNLLTTLCALGYAEQDDESRVYRLGQTARSLGQPEAAIERLRRSAKPIIRDLCRQTGETVLLAVYREGNRATVFSAESGQALRVGAQLGADKHFYDTATGRLLLARLPVGEQAACLARLGPPTPREWPEAAESRTALERELARIAGAGLAVLEKAGSHVTALAVPVAAGPDGLVAALGMYYPSVRDNATRRRELADRLRAGAECLARGINHER